MKTRASFEELRARAYEIADAGRAASWRDVAAEMEREGFAEAALRMRADPILIATLDGTVRAGPQ